MSARFVIARAMAALIAASAFQSTAGDSALFQPLPAAGVSSAVGHPQLVQRALREAGDLTARIAFAPPGAGRHEAARQSSAEVRALAALLRAGAAPHDDATAHTLTALAGALERFDLDAIASLSEQRQALEVLYAARNAAAGFADAALAEVSFATPSQEGSPNP